MPSPRFEVLHLDWEGRCVHRYPAAHDPFAPRSVKPGALRAFPPLVLVRGEGESAATKGSRAATRAAARSLFPSAPVEELPVSVRAVEVRGPQGLHGHARMSTRRYEIDILAGRPGRMFCPVAGRHVESELISVNPWRPDVYILVHLESVYGRLLTQGELEAVGLAASLAFRLAPGPFIALAPYNVRFAVARKVSETAGALAAAPAARVTAAGSGAATCPPARSNRQQQKQQKGRRR